MLHDKNYVTYKRDHHHSYQDSHHDESDILQKKENEFVKEIPKRSLSDTNVRGYMSEESMKSISIATRDIPRKDFSYFFIKKTDITKKRQMISLSSSELVKNTQDMYRARAEEAKIKKEQELKQKLEDDEKKRIALEEKRKLQDEEKIKKDKEVKGQKEIPKSREESLKVKEDLDMHEKEEVKEISKKEEREIVPKEVKLKKSTDKEGKKNEEKEVNQRKDEEKGKEKSLKEEQMRLAKEEKLKLKEEKEREKALKKDQMRLANEEKKRLKEEKEKEKALKKDQAHLAKEEKQRLKEEKEKEKALKKDLLRLANEEKQLFKEGKEKIKSPKKDQIPLDNQEKQKLKEEKEKEQALKRDQMRLASEEKKRLKEEKEKEQAIKKDQMRLASEEKQRLKEEKEKELALKKDLIRLANEENQRAKESGKSKNRENEEKSSHKDQAMTELMLKKDKESKLRKTQEDEIKKKEAELKFKSLKETKQEEKIQKPEIKKVVEEPQTKELNIDQIKIKRPSTDDLILKLVKLKQSEDHRPRQRPTRMSQINIPEKIIVGHKTHKVIKNENCVICLDSDLDLDIENIMLNEGKSDKSNEIIIGPKIFRYKSPLVLKTEDVGKCPLFFTSKPTEDDVTLNTDVIQNNIDEGNGRSIPPILAGKYVEQEVAKGITRYALSDRTFIEKGWTMLPTEKVVRKMNVYRMRPAHPEFDWFEHNKNKKLICYDTGEKLAEFDDTGKGRWFYRNGKVALDYYDAEELNAQQRIVIFSSGEPDEGGRPRPLTILATFDYLGNGIVFDHSGKIRLKYNQTEGVVLDRSIGPVSHWKWHTLNDPPVLQQVMIDTQMSHKDPQILKLGGPQENKQRPDNEEMLAIEFDNFIKEKSKKLSQKFKPFQIKMKALKINENFSLKVLDQATIYLIYRDGSTNLKLNIGMILDHQEIVDTDTAEVGEVSNSLERFPARTDSLAGLQRSVAHAQRVERSMVEREKRIRPTQPTASVDRLTSGLSRPLRTQLYTVASTTDNRFCKCRKPSTTNLYYDTRLN
ncbi:trichohyalin [Danaus plexippus]|uniref:trichohyalin n=1 Tax=Danaus plexippus TaxID=13037 RepID=UPI002AAF42E8|nr:trichohyalin [Danaus plexippus]